MDPSFGAAGTFTDQLAPASSNVVTAANGVAIQTDGKLVVSGSVTDATGHFEMLIMRLNSNGTLDRSFDANGALGGVPGAVILNPDTSIVTGGSPATSTAGQVAIQSDGKIVVAGTVGSVAIGSLPMESIVLRLTPDGSLDTSFGSGGELIHDFGVTGSGSSTTGKVIIQPNGGILIAGIASDASGHNAALVARLTASGALDPSFAAAGAFVFQGGQCASNIYTRGGTLLLQADGSIISGGAISTGTGSCGSQAEAAIFKLTSSGALDPSFGSGGLATAQFGVGSTPNSSIDSIISQPDGKLLLAGDATDAADDLDLAVARLQPGGAEDTSFGNNGVTVLQPGQGGHPVSLAGALAIRPDGSLDVAGQTTVASGGYQSLLARLQPGGSLDPSFGTNGLSLTQFGQAASPSSAFVSTLIQPDGKLIAVGTATDGNGNEQLLVSRFVGPAAPSITTTTPANGTTYLEGQKVSAAYSCTAASGDVVASCSGSVANGSVANGATLDTGTPGKYTFTVTATDSYGQQTTSTVAYTVAVPTPVLTSVTQTHKRWRDTGRPRRRKPPIGTTFSFTLNTSASVTLKFATKRGRPVGSIAITANGGANTVRFSGRIPHHKRMKPGGYTVTISATNTAGSASPSRLVFTIAK